MTTNDELIGRVALTTSQSLPGFAVDLRIGDFRAMAVTDGAGQFRLAKPKDDSCAAPDARAEVLVCTPDNQVVHRQWCAVDGRYLGITVPRKSLPRSLGRSNRLPRIPQVAPVDTVDVGRQGDIFLQDVPRRATPAGGRIVAMGDRVAAAYGSTLRVWTIDAAKLRAPAPAKVALKGVALDLAGDPDRGEFVLLVERKGKSAGRDVLGVDAKGTVARRGSIDGAWQRFAILPSKPMMAFAAPSQEDSAWALQIKDDLRVYELPWATEDVAFAEEHVLVAGGQELHTFDMNGKRLSRIAWPARRPTLVQTDADAVLAFDAARGRATRFRIDKQGNLIAGDTTRLNRRATIGWWNERHLLITLLRDLLRWWRLPPLEPLVPPRPPAPEFVFFGRT